MSKGRKPRHPMTQQQRQRMFGLAKKLGWDIDNLRSTAAQWTGKDSLSSLSKGKARQMIMQLVKLANSEEIKPLQSPQIELIKKLWPGVFESEEDFRAWLKKYHGVDHEGFLQPPLSGKVIEALKAIAKRNKNKNVK